MRILKKNIFGQLFYDSLYVYPAPLNLSYLWNFGSLALFCLVVQLLTGIFLAMHYTAHVELAFSSVEHIMRDVNSGWFLRYIHANGASAFFLIVYLHMFRGLFYGSYLYPRQIVWGFGVVIFLIMIATAFMGYVLPWGQMSFWAATVITNLASAIPLCGDSIVQWLWGGFSVDNATLNRFFSLHYLFPFLLFALAFGHLVVLHEYYSNNPLGIRTVDYVPLAPFFTWKDILGVFFFFDCFFFFVFFAPNLAGHTDNYIPANPLVTPTHIVPEWYFLPLYAILRSVPNKLAGVALLLASIVILLTFPFFMNSKIRSTSFNVVRKVFFYCFVLVCVFLGWIGSKTIETPFYECGQLSTVYYFCYFLFFLPFGHTVENNIMNL